MNGKRVGLYLRVSTGEQTIDNQREALMAAIERRGWHIVSEFEDNGVSGAKGRTKRPGFDKFIKAATTRKIDVVAAWSIDRLGRSLRDLVNFLAELDAVGCDLYLEKQAIDTTTPAGRALFQMLGVFAEFEREMIRERVCAGLARARKYGTKSGKADRTCAAAEGQDRGDSRRAGEGHGHLEDGANSRDWRQRRQGPHRASWL